MAKPHKNVGIKRIYNAMGFSFKGILSAWKHEAAFRQEVVLAVFMIPLAIYFGGTPIEKLLLICSVLLVLIVELINSAIESVVDRISDQHHELSGRAKDMGSAAVLVALIVVVVTWGILLFDWT